MERPVVNPTLRASPRFRRFWLARLLAHTAQNAILLALLVTVVNETGSTIHSSLLVLTFVVPSALFGILGGIVTDHLPKRELLVTTSLFRTAVCLLFLHGDAGVFAVYATNTAIAVITQFASPPESAVLPALVPAMQVVAATAALNLEFILSQLLGTVILAPLLIKTVGLRPLFILTAIAFLASAILYARISGLDGKPSSGSEESKRWRQGLKVSALQSWHLICSDTQILMSVVEQTLVATTVVVLVSIVPIYTRSVLHLPAEDSVAVFSPAAIGMFLSLRLIPSLARRTAKQQLVSIGFGSFVLLLAVLGFSREIALLLRQHDPAQLIGFRWLTHHYSSTFLTVVLSAPLGFAYGVVIVAARAILYERVPGPMQGRVFAFQGVLGSLASIAPLVVVGVLAGLLGPRAVLVLVAIANAVAAWYALRRTRSGPRHAAPARSDGAPGPQPQPPPA